jgi:hypothetical protein
MFEQELLLAKPLKPTKKPIAKGAEACSSSLSIGEKASTAKTSSGTSLVAKGGMKRAPLAFVKNDESSYMSMSVVDLLDSSEEELTPLKCHRRCASKSPSPDASLVLLREVDGPVIEGFLSPLFASLLLVLE